MERKTDILIIGGGPAGIVVALTAKRYYPDKEIIVLKNIEKAVVPCGIPYMVSSLKTPQDNKLSTLVLEENGIKVEIDEALKIQRSEKKVLTKKNVIYSYEKLVLAIGSRPIIPPIEGINKRGIFPIYKDMDYLEEMIKEIKKAKNIMVVGGGFIGVEFADELSKIEQAKVYLVEMLPRILGNSFDSEFGILVEEKLKSKGVNILTGKKVVKFLGEERVRKVVLSDNSEISVDVVILGIGAVPNTKLAADAGLDLGKGKGIWVDEYMRTSDLDIFAVGDCADKRDFFTRRNAAVMLASTATAEARIAGANLYQLKLVRENKGTIAVYSTYVDGLVLGSAGLTESSAKKQGFEIVVGNFEGVDKHPSTMPGVSKIKVKLVFSKHSGTILGGQVAGGSSCGELINLIGAAIQKRMSFSELETLQMATHPYLTPAPTMYSLSLAAQDAAGKI